MRNGCESAHVFVINSLTVTLRHRDTETHYRDTDMLSKMSVK